MPGEYECEMLNVDPAVVTGVFPADCPSPQLHSMIDPGGNSSGEPLELRVIVSVAARVPFSQSVAIVAELVT